MLSVRDDDYDPIAVRRVYDDMAADYVVRFGSDLAGDNPDTEFLDTAADSFPAGPVVDLGCGPGALTAELAELERGTAQMAEDLEQLRTALQTREKDALALGHEQRKLAEEYARAGQRLSVAR